MTLASKVSNGKAESLTDFQQALDNPNPCIRYWGVMGCIVLGTKAQSARKNLTKRLTDAEPLIQIQAARALIAIGESQQAVPTVRRLLAHENDVIQLRAALVVDEGQLLSSNAHLAEPLKKIRNAYAKRVVARILNSSKP